MELKKGYKNTEIGVIPEDWKVTQLKNCIIDKPKYGIGAAAINYNSNFPTYLRITDIEDDGGLRKDDLKSVNHPDSEFYFLNDGDIVFARTGASVGKSYLHIEKNGKFVYAGFLIKVSPNQKILNPVFLKSFITTQYYWNWVNVMSMRSGQPGINGNEYGELKLPLPPLSEQIAIATVLSDTDSLIQALEKKIAKKQLIKKGAMQKLLTPKEGWEVKTLGEIADVRDGTHQTPTYVEMGIPFYSVESITKNDFKNTKYITQEAHNLLTKTFRIEKGDILMTRIGSIGDCKVIDWDVNASFYVSLALLKIKPAFSSNYICHYSKTSYFKKEADINSLQSAIPKKINLGPISNIKIEVPEYKEQMRIAQILSDMDSEIESIQNKLDKYKQVKVGMMQNLLTGKIRLV